MLLLIKTLMVLITISIIGQIVRLAAYNPSDPPPSKRVIGADLVIQIGLLCWMVAVVWGV